MSFDDRLVTLSVTVEGQKKTYDQNYDIRATGVKYTDGSLGECAVRIDNISKNDRDYLVTKTSPWIVPRNYVNIDLQIGRVSTGLFLLFTGQATAANPTQPPDIGLIFTSLSMGALLGSIGNLNMGPMSTLKSISQQVANQLQIPLDYRAQSNPQVGNYAFNGALVKQVRKLNELGPVNAFIDNNKLIVVDSSPPVATGPILVSPATGMVGVPEVSELGVRVRMLVRGEIKAGNYITVQSNNNKAANGTFFVYRLSFEIASREAPFYWIIEGRKYFVGAGNSTS